jgi:hypothetical protein
MIVGMLRLQLSSLPKTQPTLSRTASETLLADIQIRVSLQSPGFQP